MKCGRGSPNYGKKRRARADGYVDVWAPEHPLARADGYVFEHRKVAWDAGVLVDSQQQVHHRNGNRSDNRLENLEPVSISEHPRLHRLGGFALANSIKTHCPKGHPLAEPNLYWINGHRTCKTCAKDRAREHKRKKLLSTVSRLPLGPSRSW